MDVQKLMELERRKAIIGALAELEVALNTFYGDGNYDDLNSIHKQLKEYKENYME